MILGIGTDIVSIARMKESLERHGERFAGRILSVDELAVFKVKSNQPAYLAKRFAAKEAVVKALGCGFRDGISMQHIIISNDLLGKPEVRLSGGADVRAKAIGMSSILLSLSDEKEYAVAYVVAQ